MRRRTIRIRYWDYRSACIYTSDTRHVTGRVLSTPRCQVDPALLTSLTLLASILISTGLVFDISVNRARPSTLSSHGFPAEESGSTLATGGQIRLLVRFHHLNSNPHIHVPFFTIVAKRGRHLAMISLRKQLEVPQPLAACCMLHAARRRPSTPSSRRV